MWNPRPPESNTKVTLELRELIENGVNIWDFEYPSFYQGDAKRAFEQKVVDHFLFRQIGQETPARWLHYFRTRVREIMPYYIQLYESEVLLKSVEDPFQAYDLTETYVEENESSGSSSSSSLDTIKDEGTHKSIGKNETLTSGGSDVVTDEERKFSNTPQGSISNLDNYLTEATVNHTDTGTEESGHSKTDTEDTVTIDDKRTVVGSDSGEHTSGYKTTYTLTRKGNIGVQPLGSEVRALRDAFLNIDLMIIDELKDLFLLVY